MRRLSYFSLLVLVCGAMELAWLMRRFGAGPGAIGVGLAVWLLAWALWGHRLPTEHPVLARAVMYTAPIGALLWLLGWVASGFAPLDLSPWVLGWLAGVLGLALAILVGATNPDAR